MKTGNNKQKKWYSINVKASIETEYVLSEIKKLQINRIVKIVILWIAVKMLRKKGTNTIALYYVMFVLGLVVSPVPILEFLIEHFLSEDSSTKIFFNFLLKYYRETNIDYIALLFVTFVVAWAIYMSYLKRKVEVNEEFLQNYKYLALKPIVSFGDFVDFYQKNEVKRFVDDPVYIKVREYLADSKKGHIRLLALSGTGKTFLIQSAFIDTNDLNKVFYCDEVRHPDMMSAAINLKNEVEGATLILDNCPSDICDKVISRIGDKVRIISAYYDPRDTASKAPTLTFEKCDMQKVIRQIVEENIDRNIPEDIKQKIILHSGNIPFMAMLLVTAYNKSEGVYYTIDETLLDHLLDINGQHPKEQRIAMRTLALFQPLDFDNGNSEVARFLINSDNFTPIEASLNRELLFKNIINNLYERNLIDLDSSYINVRPQPLAIWLVGEWIKERGKGIVDAIIELSQQENSIKNPLIEAWSMRLEYMQGNKDAEKIYEQLVDVNGGPFATEDVVCSDYGSRLILAMSTVNPVVIVNCLYSVLYKQSINWLKQKLEGNARRNVVNTLEKLCFSRKSFHKAALLLARLAIAENEEWSNNSIGQFKQLFHVYLAGTEVNFDERLKVIKELFEQGQDYYTLLYETLKSSFAIEYLSRIKGAEKFGFIELKEFTPQYKDINKYWDDLYALMVNWVKTTDFFVPKVAEIACLNTRCFIREGRIDLLIKLLELIAPKLNYKWNEMYREINDAICCEKLIENEKGQLTEWSKKLEPSDIINKMKIAVRNLYLQPFEIDEQIKREEEIVIPFAHEFVRNKAYLTNELKSLVLDSNDYISWAFYKHVADNLNSSDIVLMGEYILKILSSQKHDFYTRTLVSLYNYIGNKEETKNLINGLKDQKYYNLAFALMAVTDNEEKGYLKDILQLVKKGSISKKDVHNYFSAKRLTNAQEIYEIVNIIHTNISDITLEYDFISNYWYLEDLYVNTVLVNVYKRILIDYPITNTLQYNYQYTQQVKSMLTRTNDGSFAKLINEKMIKVFNSHLPHNGLEDLYQILLTKYRNDIWPKFLTALLDIEKKPGFFICLRHSIGSGFGFGEGPLFKGYEEQMKQVCKDNPKYGPLVCAALCPVFESVENTQGEIKSFHPFAIWLIQFYGDNKKILDEFHANLGTFHWTGSTQPLYERIKLCFTNLQKNEKLSPEAKKWIDKCLSSNDFDLSKEKKNMAFMRMKYGVDG